MMDFMGWFDGKKTYLIAASMIVAAGLQAQGFIGPDTYKWVEGILLGGGFMALRRGIAR